MRNKVSSREVDIASSILEKKCSALILNPVGQLPRGTRQFLADRPHISGHVHLRIGERDLEPGVNVHLVNPDFKRFGIVSLFSFCSSHSPYIKGLFHNFTNILYNWNLSYSSDNIVNIGFCSSIWMIFFQRGCLPRIWSGSYWAGEVPGASPTMEWSSFWRKTKFRSTFWLEFPLELKFRHRSGDYIQVLFVKRSIWVLFIVTWEKGTTSKARTSKFEKARSSKLLVRTPKVLREVWFYVVHKKIQNDWQLQEENTWIFQLVILIIWV